MFKVGDIVRFKNREESLKEYLSFNQDFSEKYPGHYQITKVGEPRDMYTMIYFLFIDGKSVGPYRAFRFKKVATCLQQRILELL